ncbi:VOC family protein [Tunturiibacter lichenicola]|uniref:VOC family protein n=1 Tax=Tunturiibacter lichenicola TaxID=2051959 RepID=UPI003D9B5185
MSNLENLRKQAKQYLRWHRERYYPVAAIIREYLPRFGQLSDPEILAAEFKLADAQELVAREKGFAGWQALRTGADTVSQPTKQNAVPPMSKVQPVLNSVAAHLFVRDINASCEFFASRLGFAVDFVYGDPPFYGQVSRDKVKLALRHVDEPVFAVSDAGDIREREDLVLASITVASVEEIKQLFLMYQAADVPFHQTLKKEPWGARTFIVRDPDGNLILFAGPAE